MGASFSNVAVGLWYDRLLPVSLLAGVIVATIIIAVGRNKFLGLVDMLMRDGMDSGSECSMLACRRDLRRGDDYRTSFFYTMDISPVVTVVVATTTTSVKAHPQRLSTLPFCGAATLFVLPRVFLRWNRSNLAVVSPLSG